eukprot:4122501-Karenia_brevis.AAC.1
MNRTLNATWTGDLSLNTEIIIWVKPKWLWHLHSNTNAASPLGRCSSHWCQEWLQSVVLAEESGEVEKIEGVAFLCFPLHSTAPLPCTHGNTPCPHSKFIKLQFFNAVRSRLVRKPSSSQGLTGRDNVSGIPTYDIYHNSCFQT